MEIIEISSSDDSDSGIESNRMNKEDELKEWNRDVMQYLKVLLSDDSDSEPNIIEKSIVIKKEECSTTEIIDIIEISSSDENDSDDESNRNVEACCLLIPRVHLSRIKKNLKMFETVLKCKKCDEMFKTGSLLKYHYRKHHTFRKFACLSCEKRFHHSYTLTAHVDYEHASISDKIKRYRCDKCPSSFSVKRNILQHYKLEHTSQEQLANKFGRPDSSGNFACKVCDQVMKSRDSLRIHFDYFHQEGEERRHKCSSCERSFNIKDAFLRHLRTHGNNGRKRKRLSCKRQGSGGIIRGRSKKLSCDYCDKIFINRNACLRHMDKIHENGRHKRYLCDQCPRSFNILDNFNSHKSVAHKVSTKCELCEKNFRNSENLERHNDWYHPSLDTSRKLICDHCPITNPQAYRFEANLQRHKVESHGVKSFQCQFCDETFSRVDQLHMHKDFAHNLEEGITKKYPCGHCSMSFREKRSFWRHLREKHLIWSETSCNICEKKFHSKDGLNYHNDIHHQLNVEIKKRHICQFCPRSFNTIKAQRSHNFNEHRAMIPQRKRRSRQSVETHINFAEAGAYHCKQCKHNFFSTESRRSHIDFHHGHDDGRIRKYQCDKCGMSFNEKQNIARHVISHKQSYTMKAKRDKVKKKNREEQKEDLFCKYCGIEYFTSRGARQHEDFAHESFSHGERRYRCTKCNSSFDYLSNIKRHMQKCLDTNSETGMVDDFVVGRRSIRHIMKTESEWQNDFDLEDFEIKKEKDD